MTGYKFEPNPDDRELIAFLQEHGTEDQGRAVKKLTSEQLFIRRLVDVRINKRCAQIVLAQRSGISQPALARIEAGKSSPTLKTLVKLAEALDMEIMLLRKQR